MPVSAFDATFAAVGAPALYGFFGDPATFTPMRGMPPVAGTPVATTVTVSETVADLFIGAEQGQERERVAMIMMPMSDVPAEPVRGDSINVPAPAPRAGNWAVKAVKGRDGGKWTLECHIVSVPRPGAKGAQGVR